MGKKIWNKSFSNASHSLSELIPLSLTPVGDENILFNAGNFKGMVLLNPEGNVSWSTFESKESFSKVKNSSIFSQLISSYFSEIPVNLYLTDVNPSVIHMFNIATKKMTYNFIEDPDLTNLFIVRLGSLIYVSRSASNPQAIVLKPVSSTSSTKKEKITIPLESGTIIENISPYFSNNFVVSGEGINIQSNVVLRLLKFDMNGNKQ